MCVLDIKNCKPEMNFFPFYFVHLEKKMYVLLQLKRSVKERKRSKNNFKLIKLNHSKPGIFFLYKENWYLNKSDTEDKV